MVKFDSWDATIGKIKGLLQAEFSRHAVLASSESIADYEKVYYNTVLDSQYDKYFGFTYPEVKTMLAYYGVSKKEAELREKSKINGRQ